MDNSLTTENAVTVESLTNDSNAVTLENLTNDNNAVTVENHVVNMYRSTAQKEFDNLPPQSTRRSVPLSIGTGELPLQATIDQLPLNIRREVDEYLIMHRLGLTKSATFEQRSYGNVVAKFEFPDNSTYKGICHNARPHGYGTLEFADGRKYVGAFEYGRLHGLGIFSWADGQSITGTFVHGAFTGCGLCSNDEGNINTGAIFESGVAVETLQSEYPGDVVEPVSRYTKTKRSAICC